MRPVQFRSKFRGPPWRDWLSCLPAWFWSMDTTLGTMRRCALMALDILPLHLSPAPQSSLTTHILLKTPRPNSSLGLCRAKPHRGQCLGPLSIPFSLCKWVFRAQSCRSRALILPPISQEALEAHRRDDLPEPEAIHCPALSAQFTQYVEPNCSEEIELWVWKCL